MAKQGVEAVERALSLLESFSQQQQTLTLTQLANATGMYKSTVLRLTASLERFRYLVRHEDGQFAIGQAVWRLGLLYRQSYDLEPIIRPELIRLVEATGETASFYVREGDVRVCLYRENSPKAARHHLDEGVALPLESGASGHVLKAFTLRSPDERDVRVQGYAVSLGDRDPDLAAIAVPIMDETGNLKGALAISGIVTRFTLEKRTVMLHLLKEAAGRLQEVMAATTGGACRAEASKASISEGCAERFQNHRRAR